MLRQSTPNRRFGFINEKLKQIQRFGSAQLRKFVRLNSLTTPCSQPLAIIKKMKHKILEEYNGTKILYSINNKIYTIRGQNDVLYENNSKLDSNVEMYHISSYNGNICYAKESKTIFKNSVIDKNIVVGTISGNYAVFTSDFDLENSTLKYEVVNINTGQVIHDFGSQTYMSKLSVRDTDFFLIVPDSILYFNKESGVSKRRLFSELMPEIDSEFKDVIGIMDNSLFLNTINNHVIEINTTAWTVETIWHSLPGLQIGSRYKDVIPDASIFELDITSYKLIGFFSRHYLEIDVKTKRIAFVDLTDSIKRKGINSVRPTSPLPINDKYIFIIGHFDLPQKPEIDFKGVVVIRKEDLSIYDTFVFEDTDIGTRTPILSDSKFYLVDWEKRVHEFELE